MELDMPMAPGVFERRNCVTRDQIARVTLWWCFKPSPYRSYAEYSACLAAAFRAREEFYEDLIAYAMRQGPGGMWFTVLLDARDGCRAEARQARGQAREAARRDQDQAWRSYAGNVAAVV